MTYDVVIEPPAKENIACAYHFIRADSRAAADRWLRGLERSIQSLAGFPARHGLARENDEFDEEIRQLLYGKRQHVYRVLFVIRGSRVHVLHVRHAARPKMRPDEIQP